MTKTTHFAWTSNSSLWTKDTGLDHLSGELVAPFTPENDAMIFCSYSLEKGARYHLQGYCVYRTPRSMKDVKADLPSGAHIERMKATVGQNEVYCGSKKPGETHIRGPWTFGAADAVPENPAAKLPAYADLITMVKEGKSERDVIEKHPFFLDHPRALEKAFKMFSPPPVTSREVKVYLVYGEPHSGKTEACQRAFPDHFLVCGGNTLSSFSGYAGQSTIIFDAYKPHEWPLTVVEQFIKPPIVLVNVKYGCVKTLWSTVIITTNCHPDSLYLGDVSRDSLFRRLSKIIHVEYTEVAPAEPKIIDFN